MLPIFCMSEMVFCEIYHNFFLIKSRHVHTMCEFRLWSLQFSGITYELLVKLTILTMNTSTKKQSSKTMNYNDFFLSCILLKPSRLRNNQFTLCSVPHINSLFGLIPWIMKAWFVLAVLVVQFLLHPTHHLLTNMFQICINSFPCWI